MEQLCNAIVDMIPFGVYWTIGVAAVGFISTITLAIVAFSRINRRRREIRSRFNRKDW